MTRIPILFTAALAAACTTADPAPLDDEATADKAAPACPQPLVHDLPDLHGACTYGTTRCNGNTVEICGNDDTGYLSWEHVATCASTCTGDGTCGQATSAGADLPDEKVAALIEELAASCEAETGDPTCGEPPSPFDPSGSLLAAVENLEIDHGPVCAACNAYSDQPCSCDPLENPSSYCYDESGLDPPAGGWFAIGPLVRIVATGYKIFRGGAKVAGFSRGFITNYRNAQVAHDASMLAFRQGRMIAARALAREAITECAKATGQIAAAGANLVLTGQLVKQLFDQFKANPDANEVQITVDGQVRNISREQYNDLLKQWKSDVKQLKAQVTEIEKIEKDADMILRDE